MRQWNEPDIGIAFGNGNGTTLHIRWIEALLADTRQFGIASREEHDQRFRMVTMYSDSQVGATDTYVCVTAGENFNFGPQSMATRFQTEQGAVELALMIQGETTFTAEECRAIYRLARTVQGRWIELGSWCGRSYTATAMGLSPGSELVAVDLLNGAMQTGGARHALAPSPRWVFDHFLAALHACEDLRPDCRFRYIQSETVQAAAEFEDASVDAVFVDADHRYDRVRADITTWFPKVRSGGIVAGHDYWDQDPGVVQAVNEIFGSKCRTIPNTRIWHVKK